MQLHRRFAPRWLVLTAMSMVCSAWVLVDQTAGQQGVAVESDTGALTIAPSDDASLLVEEPQAPAAGESGKQHQAPRGGDPSAPETDSDSKPSTAQAGVPDSSKIKRPNSNSNNTPKSHANETASLEGVRPGHTTREELHTLWGFAWQTKEFAGGVNELYTIQHPDQLRVTIVENIVKSVVKRLTRPVEADVLAKRMDLEDFEPVDVLDERGQVSGRAYLERGVVMRFSSPNDATQVSQINIEATDARPFIIRAEARLAVRYADCSADVKHALELAPDNGRAHWLQAEVALRSGHLEPALKSARKAIELESTEPDYYLTLAQILAASGDYAEAIRQVSGAIERNAAMPLLVARAHCLWGDYLAAAEQHDYPQAIQHHTQAIKLAKPLTTSQKPQERRAAKELLIDANLAVAHDIGWGCWRDQSTVISLWIDRATALADELVKEENGSTELLLRVDEQTISALAGLTQPPEATKWIEGAIELGKSIIDEATDATYQARIAWNLGMALSDAMQIEKTLGHRDKALALGKTALAYLEQGEQFGTQLPMHDYLRGRSYYRLGAIFVVDPIDNKEALTWFGKAVSLLESQAPSAAVDCGRRGEMLVSMAVSYWEVDNRQEALRLTRQGIQWMDEANGKGLLAETAMAKPYGNMAIMYQQLGDAQAAKQFAELAARYGETKSR